MRRQRRWWWRQRRGEKKKWERDEKETCSVTWTDSITLQVFKESHVSYILFHRFSQVPVFHPWLPFSSWGILIRNHPTSSSSLFLVSCEFNRKRKERCIPRARCLFEQKDKDFKKTEDPSLSSSQPRKTSWGKIEESSLTKNKMSRWRSGSKGRRIKIKGTGQGLFPWKNNEEKNIWERKWKENNNWKNEKRDSGWRNTWTVKVERTQHQEVVEGDKFRNESKGWGERSQGKISLQVFLFQIMKRERKRRRGKKKKNTGTKRGPPQSSSSHVTSYFFSPNLFLPYFAILSLHDFLTRAKREKESWGHQEMRVHFSCTHLLVFFSSLTLSLSLSLMMY